MNPHLYRQRPPPPPSWGLPCLALSIFTAQIPVKTITETTRILW